MYGMRTIIPISIGLTRYDARKFAFINLISAWCWAALTIVPVWYFGEQIMIVLHWAKPTLVYGYSYCSCSWRKYCLLFS